VTKVAFCKASEEKSERPEQSEKVQSEKKEREKREALRDDKREPVDGGGENGFGIGEKPCAREYTLALNEASAEIAGGLTLKQLGGGEKLLVGLSKGFWVERDSPNL